MGLSSRELALNGAMYQKARGLGSTITYKL